MDVDRRLDSKTQVGGAVLQRGQLGQKIRSSLSDSRGVQTVVGTVLLILVVGAASAVADESLSSATQEAASYTPGWTSLAELEKAADEGDAIALPGPAVNSEAAATLPRQDLNRDEAIELVTSVFGEVLAEPTSTFDDLGIQSFRSDHVALVEPADSPGVPDPQLGLLSSALPLRVAEEDGVKKPVALDLEFAEGELQPQNPLVEVGLPAQIRDGISMPDAGLSIELVGAEDRAASNLEQTAAFYPNVAPESDLAVAPTATGVETFTHLRSPEAPHSQTYRLQMPASAELRASPDGGATVTDGDATMLRVLPPSGIDAEGNPVPVSLEVANSSLTVRAKPTAENVYPLLIDPVFESFSWEQLGAQSPEWLPFNSPGMTATWGAWGGPGMIMYSGNFSSVTPGAQANWNYYVPRFFTDMAQVGSRPTSYIKKMTMSKLAFFWNFSPSSPGPASPYLMMGLWSESKGQWVSLGTRDGFQGPLNDPNYQYVFVNPDEVTDAKNGGIALVTSESQLPGQRNVKVEQATVEISDKDSPAFGSLGNPAAWVNGQATAAITYKVSDPGLGVREIEVSQPTFLPTASSVTTSADCLGTVAKPCPRTLQSPQTPLQYNPATMPQGENWLTIVPKDPVLHQATGEARVKVDHSQPTLALSGTLTEQATVGTTAQKYTLKYDAADGDSASAAAQAPFGSAGTAVGQLQRPMGVAVDSAGNKYVVDRECKCVQKYGPAGNFLVQFSAAGLSEGAQKFTDPRGIAVSPTGDLWVADMGNKRVYQLSSGGSLLRTVEYSGFVMPYAVAAGSGGIVWISDIGAHKVFKFDPGYSGNGLPVVYGTKANPTGGQADLASPVGLAVDATGTLWVTDADLDRVTTYNANGQWIGQFGSAGTGNGQFNLPFGISIAPSTGNVLVSDATSNRVQEFRANGEYVRQFGALGAASNQLNEPRGIALDANRNLYIADAANKRIAKWTHGSYDPQSGVASTEIRIDGNLVEPKYAPGCATKDCPVSREWPLNADDYAVGAHTVKVTATDSVGLSTSKTLAIETHGDLAPPAIGLSGTMTEQATLGTTRPTYKLKVSATDPGGTEERKSGVASTTIKVDGTTVDSSAPGCPAGGCSLTREWTLDANSYSAGGHTVQVTASDAAGRSTTKSLAITINRDTTPPEIITTGPWNTLFNRPEGWVEQKSYSYFPTAKDLNGYGVTSMVVKLDGASISSKTQSCSGGSCEAYVFGSLDMAAYDGGAHSAEVVATDGAGNSRKKTLPINVDPAGLISIGEAEDTLEALDATSEVNTVGPSVAEASYEGTAPDLTLEEGGEGVGLEGSGNVVPITVDGDAGAGVTVDVADPAYLQPTCSSEPPAEERSTQLTGQEEEEVPVTPEAGCAPMDEPTEGLAPYLPVEVTPLAVGVNASDTQLTSGSTAAVSANVAQHVDLITRPVFDGAMTFAAIRDPAAPTSYSWKVRLDPDQELKLLDSQQAAVYTGSRPAFTIAAQLAHDAIGSAVPTSLAVSGDVLTLNVDHHAAGPGGGSFIYPVVGGAGWQGGFQTYEIKLPPTATWEEQQEEEEFGVVNDSGKPMVKIMSSGPPLLQAGTSGAELTPKTVARNEKKFKFTFCRPHNVPNDPFDGKFGESPWETGRPGVNLPKIVSECHREDFEGVYWGVSVYGRFHYIYEHWVWLNPDQWGCHKWGEREHEPAKINCRALYPEPRTGTAGAIHGPINVIGEYRFRPGHGEWAAAARATCLTEGGKLYPNPRRAFDVPYERPMILEWEYVIAGVEACNWIGPDD